MAICMKHSGALVLLTRHLSLHAKPLKRHRQRSQEGGRGGGKRRSGADGWGGGKQGASRRWRHMTACILCVLDRNKVCARVLTMT